MILRHITMLIERTQQRTYLSTVYTARDRPSNTARFMVVTEYASVVPEHRAKNVMHGVRFWSIVRE
jgi:hypothetical protein